MPVTEMEGAVLKVPKFITSDGQEFVPKLDSHYSVSAAIASAKSLAEEHERDLKARKDLAECVQRLFGDKADEVLAVLWTPRMKGFARRLDVLRAIDSELNG